MRRTVEMILIALCVDAATDTLAAAVGPAAAFSLAGTAAYLCLAWMVGRKRRMAAAAAHNDRLEAEIARLTQENAALQARR